MYTEILTHIIVLYPAVFKLFLYSKMYMEIIADLIYLIHLAVVLFIVFAPFSNSLSILILHVAFSMTLIIHWKTNSNVCCLTIAESWFRGVEMSGTFLNKIMEPVYKISENKMSSIIWTVTLVMMAVSCYKIYYHQNIPLLLSCKDFESCSKLLV